MSHGFVKECCNVPPVEAKYIPKGKYIDFAGFHSYAIGPEDAKGAVLYIYDVFGFSPQILQGADLLASQGFRVVMPDITKGDIASIDMFGDSEESKKKKDAWFGGFPGKVNSQSKNIANFIKALKAAGYAKVGAVGACWGYKCIVVSEGAGELDAIIGTHPSFADPSDVDNIKAPLCLLPSQNEDMTTMNAIYNAVEAKNPGKNFIKRYDTMEHGWMAARCDLNDIEQAAKFREGFTDVSNFLKAALA